MVGSLHFGAFASFFMRVCVCARARVRAFVFIYVHVWRPEVSLGCHSSGCAAHPERFYSLLVLQVSGVGLTAL